MIEDAINRLAAAIEAQNLIQTENQRLFAELVAAGRPVTPAAAVVIENAPGEFRGEFPGEIRGEFRKAEQKVERKSKKPPEAISAKEPVAEPVAEPITEPETDTRPVSRKDLTDFALSLSRQDSTFGARIKAVLAIHGAKTISVLDEDKIGIVFAELNNMAQELAREPGEEG
jgi:hypothetical protein